MKKHPMALHSHWVLFICENINPRKQPAPTKPQEFLQLNGYDVIFERTAIHKDST